MAIFYWGLLLEVIVLQVLTHFLSQHHDEVGTITIHILQKTKLKLHN